ncbi:GNAT family protein [Desulfonatronospira sp.]|uniref:GNAT family N-acetyltransferase n=1 Tax=Desulfonatronospira sp. TaxID=1962951 RepID=UPI0025C52B63|nr:GNAT family protein [Desulfonatronospira sp.]
MVEPVLRAGETYPFPPDITESQAFDVWVQVPVATFVAEYDKKTVVGTYYIKPNQPGLGAHVCNCGYIVTQEARGKGIASRMCRHSQEEAVARGFRAMQYNMVVSTNEVALHIWKKNGFQVVGRLPKAFKHAKHGFVDAFIMYKELQTVSV